MKVNLFYLIVLQVIFLNNVSAQWTPLVSGTTNQLEEIFFPAPDTGYATGWSGTIVKTTDGTTWTPLSIGSSKNLLDVFFLDTQTGFVVGDSGLFAKTTDGGNNWSLQYLTNVNPIDLSSVYFTDANTGFAGGREDVSKGIIFKTIDGGINWTVTNTPSNSVFDFNYNRLIFPVADTGYALTRGFCIKTTDAGDNWFYTDTFLFNNGLMFSILEDAYFFSSDTGYVVGWYNPFTGYTYNGGTTWSDLALFNGQWQSMDFPSRQIGYMVGWGQLIKTVDGGTTWNDITSPLIQNGSLLSMDFTDDWTGYACGSNGTIIKTTNGGTTSVSELNSQNEIIIYPNPVSKEFKIQSSKFKGGEKIELKICDVVGKEILNKELSASDWKIDVSKFENGIYLLKINSGKNIFLKKIVVQK